MNGRIDDTAISLMIKGVVAEAGQWTGTATELLSALAQNVSESVRYDQNFPKDAVRFSHRLRRIEKQLIDNGINLQFSRIGKDRVRTVTLVAREQSATPAVSAKATVDVDAVLEEWDDGVREMHQMRCPPQGYTPARWREVCADADALLDNHGARLAELHWDTVDLFGCEPDHPGQAQCLVVLLRGGNVMNVSGREVILMARHGVNTHRRRYTSTVVPFWSPSVRRADAGWCAMVGNTYG